jgi:hypothetical protein
MWFNLTLIITVFVCYILLLKSNLERYETEIQLDINQDENGDIILSEEEKKKQRDNIDEKRKSTDYARLQQLRATQESNKREADYGVSSLGFSPSQKGSEQESTRQTQYSQHEINPH